MHANQIKHGLKKKIDECSFTSYQSVFGDQETKLEREKALTLFGGKHQFIDLHQNTIDYYYRHPKSMED